MPQVQRENLHAVIIDGREEGESCLFEEELWVAGFPVYRCLGVGLHKEKLADEIAVRSVLVACYHSHASTLSNQQHQLHLCNLHGQWAGVRVEERGEGEPIPCWSQAELHGGREGGGRKGGGQSGKEDIEC